MSSCKESRIKNIKNARKSKNLGQLRVGVQFLSLKTEWTPGDPIPKRKIYLVYWFNYFGHKLVLQKLYLKFQDMDRGVSIYMHLLEPAIVSMSLGEHESFKQRPILKHCPNRPVNSMPRNFSIRSGSSPKVFNLSKSGTRDTRQYFAFLPSSRLAFKQPS